MSRSHEMSQELLQQRSLTMPAEYFQETIRSQVPLTSSGTDLFKAVTEIPRQLRSLLEVNVLKDINITLRTSSIQMNSWILCLVSPMLRMSLCGGFAENASKLISLEDVEETNFLMTMRLACGDEVPVPGNIEDLVGLGMVADRLQIDPVRIFLEDMISKELTNDNCIEIFRRLECSGLERLQRKTYKFLRGNFELASRNADFLELSEETIAALLAEDELGASGEEVVFEAVVNWMKQGEKSGVRGQGLLRNIRFGVIDDEYLSGNLLCAELRENAELRQLLAEAKAKKGRDQEDVWDGLVRLCEKWRMHRKAPAPVIKLPAGAYIGADIFLDPCGVAIDNDGRILVCDATQNQIIVFDHDGSVARRIGSEGTAAGEFMDLKRMAVDRQGRMIVADCGNHRIQVLNPDGSVALSFGERLGDSVGQLFSPYGVAIDREGRFVVADCRNHRVQAFSADGTFVRSFGWEGAGVGQLWFPSDVAVDGAGRIVVSDTNNHRVQVFNGDGSVALCFGSQGDGPGQLNFPYGVAVDGRSRFVVADSHNHRVQIFNPDGSASESHVVGGAGDGVGQGQLYPCDVAVDGDGRIVVSICGDGAIKRSVQVIC